MAAVEPLSQLRLPPHSVAAEQAVLGALLIDAKAWPLVSRMLDAIDFHRLDHRLLYAAIARVAGRNETPDVVTLTAELERRGELEQVGGQGWLYTLVRQTATPATVENYAAVVRERAQLRKLAELAQSLETMALGQSGDNAETIAAQAASQLSAIQSRAQTGSGLVRIEDISRALIDDLDTRAEGKRKGLATGLADFDYMTGGLEAGDLAFFAGRPGMGKAQPLDEPVLTPDGWRCMGDIRYGDVVVGPDGSPRRVDGVFPQGRLRVWKVIFADGREVRCTADHLWTINSSRWAAQKTITTEQLRQELAKVRNRLRLRTPAFSGQYGGIRVIGLDPYLLGCWLGDGDPRGNITAPSTKLHLLQAAGAKWGVVGKDRRRADVCCVAIKGLRAAIRQLGLFGKRAHEKEIPSAYMHAPRKQRMAILQGLLDTDGWVEKHSTVRFSSCSRRLSEQVRELIWSLGGEASIAIKPTSRRNAYVVNIRVRNPRELFRHEEKKARCASVCKISPRIVAAEATDEYAECQCIKVSASDALYVTKGYIVTHNTGLLITVSAHVSRDTWVAVFSAEMPSLQLARRLTALLGQIPQDKLRRPERMTDDDWARVTEATRAMSERRIAIDDRHLPSLEHIRAECMGFRARHGMGLVCIDYAQLVQAPGKNAHESMTKVAYGAKALAKELECPIIMLAQLNRSVEMRENRRPRMSDLRESGSLEEAADIIGMLYREGYYDDQFDMPFTIECNIEKHRNGERGQCLWHFSGEFSRMTALDDTARRQYRHLIAGRRKGESDG